MPQGTLSQTEEERFVAEMARQMTVLAQRLCTWVREQERTLETIEAEVRPLLQELGGHMLAGLCQGQAPTYPADTVVCPCGQRATYQRRRSAWVKTLLGSIAVE